MVQPADAVTIRATGEQIALREFLAKIGRRVGLQVTSRGGEADLVVDAARVEALGPLIEAASVAHGIELRIAEVDAAVESGGLGGRPSRIWAAIGNAADEREVARDRGASPQIELMDYIRLEEVDGRRVARDGRRPLLDAPTSIPSDFFPVKFDDAGWHVEGTARAGQPADHAWTHMALFLTWLIRHDLVDGQLIPSSRAEAVRAGDVVGRDLMNWIDQKLVSIMMTDQGASFSRARYDEYLKAYGEVFSAEPDYSFPADRAAYARIEPVIDRLWADWRAASDRV